tara:strand:- start:275 stop:394 length:120 start_codon:yes stop_codon:yes gene_type:complete
MVNKTLKSDVDETIREILKYCKLNTYAMVTILEKLNEFG